jgi:hypothetical protein
MFPRQKGFLITTHALRLPFSHEQVLNSAWDAGIPVASENALPCYDRQGFNKILENAKPRTDPDGRCLAAFTYLRLNPTLMEEKNFKEFRRFVKRLHGEGSHGLMVSGRQRSLCHLVFGQLDRNFCIVGGYESFYKTLASFQLTE